MLKNYLILAIRNVRRRPVYTLINIVGLAVGIGCCLLIMLYVHDELSYDRFHEHADRIVRFVEDQTIEDRVSQQATTYPALASALESAFPEIESIVRFLPYPMLAIKSPAEKYQEDRFTFVDSTFLDVFSFTMLHGDETSALDSPFSLVLTESTAAKYFGDANPVGETLQLRDDEESFEFTIRGVIEDPPATSHFAFSMLGSITSMRAFYPWALSPHNWYNPTLYTYGLVAPGTDLAGVRDRLPQFEETYMGEELAATRALDIERLVDIHLYSERENDITPGSDIGYIFSFSLIALFILLIACVNFINLAVAQSTMRAREVGMRKTLGAFRRQLIHQFLAESSLSVLVAVMLAHILMYVSLPFFNDLTGKTMALSGLYRFHLPYLLVAIVVVIMVLTGGYPALVFSKVKPIAALRGLSLSSGTSRVTLARKGLVVFQFCVSIALLVGTLVVLKQLDFLQNQRLGFSKEHVVMVPFRELDNQFNHKSLKMRWEQHPGVLSVAASSGMPGLEGGLYELKVRPEEALVDSAQVLTLTVDHDYVRTFGMNVIAGRDFSEDYATDATEGFLINERAASAWGWQNPIGKEISIQVWFDGYVQKTGRVIGVVEDFQYTSLRQEIAPIIMHIFPDTYYYDYISVRIGAEDIPNTLAALEAGWQQFNPDRPFEYTFLDEKFDAMYQAESRLSRLIGLFAFMAVGIACLGLFGLASFMIERRVKEVGIRKVLGASVGSIVLLLSKDFLQLVAVAYAVSIPIAFIAMQRWLEGFAYHVELGWTVFVLAGAGAVLLTLVTISYQTLRAAFTNPVNTLRAE